VESVEHRPMLDDGSLSERSQVRPAASRTCQSAYACRGSENQSLSIYIYMLNYG
jgi:hypothetical protein